MCFNNIEIIPDYFRITSYNVCYTKLLRKERHDEQITKELIVCRLNQPLEVLVLEKRRRENQNCIQSVEHGKGNAQGQ